MSDPRSRPIDIDLHIGRISMDPHRIIYATILMMTAYAIYNEGDGAFGATTYLQVVALSIAPLFALSMAHAFSDALDLQIRYGRKLTGHDRRHLLAENIQYVYVAIPPIILISILALLGWKVDDAVSVVLVLGLLSLGWWGWFAGRKAGVSRARQWTFALNYFLMGLLVVAVELLLTH